MDEESKAGEPLYRAVEEVDQRSTARRIAIAAAGAAVTFTGVLMLVLPGPAFIVIPIGLAILAAEFRWARRWLAKLKRLSMSTLERPQPESGRDELSDDPTTTVASELRETAGAAGDEREN